MDGVLHLAGWKLQVPACSLLCHLAAEFQQERSATGILVSVLTAAGLCCCGHGLWFSIAGQSQAARHRAGLCLLLSYPPNHPLA